jgi:hypothetical protein
MRIHRRIISMLASRFSQLTRVARLAPRDPEVN